MPEVSIVMPAFNAEDYIGEAIASVLAQSIAGWELIVVDDGSTDRTGVIVQSFDDRRITLLRQSNRGVSAARNAALDHARGEFVTFLDADDLLPSDALATRAAYLRGNVRVDIANGAVAVTRNDEVISMCRPDLQEGPFLPRIARLEEGVFFIVAYMIRRSKIGNYRFPEEMTNSEDLAFFMQLAHDRRLTYGAVSETVYEYRKRSGSAMDSLRGVERGYLQLLKRLPGMPEIQKADRRRLVLRVASIILKSRLAQIPYLRRVARLRHL